MLILTTAVILVFIFNPIVSSAESESESINDVHVIDSDSSEPIEHENPGAYGYPDVRKEYIPAGIKPQYAYFPSPDDDGTYIKVLMQDRFLPPGAEPVPAAAAPPRVDFYLYTKKNPDNPIKIYSRKSNKDAIASVFNPEAPVKILCHGFLSNYKKPFPVRMKNAYLNLGEDLNVIVVDWKDTLGWMGYYPDAARATKYVGEEVSFLIQGLLTDNLTDLSKIHYIGHSLGAQAGGAAAYYLSKNEKLGKMNRITGLDPAGPYFCNEENKHLNAEDAEFVDVIHTDDGLYCQSWWQTLKLLAKGKWGSELTVGIADFYPNGGAHQRGCSTDAVMDSCSHSRSYYYMEESFNTTEAAKGYVFKGCLCENYIQYLNDDCDCKDHSLMGEYASRNAKGKYFLRTGKTYPYANVG